jgi:hypothetical protein
MNAERLNLLAIRIGDLKAKVSVDEADDEKVGRLVTDMDTLEMLCRERNAVPPACICGDAIPACICGDAEKALRRHLSQKISEMITEIPRKYAFTSGLNSLFIQIAYDVLVLDFVY